MGLGEGHGLRFIATGLAAAAGRPGLLAMVVELQGLKPWCVSPAESASSAAAHADGREAASAGASGAKREQVAVAFLYPNLGACAVGVRFWPRLLLLRNLFCL